MFFRFSTITLLSLSFLFSLSAEAKAIELKNWTTIANLMQQSISVEGNATTTQGIYVLPLKEDIINLSKRNDLDDIRIIDVDNNEIPYVFVTSKQGATSTIEERTDAKIMENATSRDGKTTVVLDLNKQAVFYNNLYLSRDNASINFRKKIKAYISDTPLKANSSSWKEFEQKNVIYNYTDGSFAVDKLNINLFGISSRYLKLELTDDTKTSGKLTIRSAELGYMKDEDADFSYTIKEYLSGNFTFQNLSIYKESEVLDNIEKDTRSEIIYDGGINAEELTLKVENGSKNFHRNVEVQGSDDDVVWNTISTSTVFRIDSSVYKGEMLNLRIPTSTYKKFKIIIENGTEKPLEISKPAKLKLQNVGVLFVTDPLVSVHDLRILAGNNTELSPIYDITSTIGIAQNATPEIIQYQNLKKNPEYKAVRRLIPKGEQNKIYLNFGLLAVVLVMGIVGFFWMKNKHE